MGEVLWIGDTAVGGCGIGECAIEECDGGLL